MKIIILAVFILSGCVTVPVFETGNQRSVTIKYDEFMHKPADRQSLADSYCAKHKRVAVFKSSENARMGLRYGHYDCVEQ